MLEITHLLVNLRKCYSKKGILFFKSVAKEERDESKENQLFYLNFITKKNPPKHFAIISDTGK